MATRTVISAVAITPASLQRQKHELHGHLPENQTSQQVTKNTIKRGISIIIDQEQQPNLQTQQQQHENQSKENSKIKIYQRNNSNNNNNVNGSTMPTSVVAATKTTSSSSTLGRATTMRSPEASATSRTILFQMSPQTQAAAPTTTTKVTATTISSNSKHNNKMTFNDIHRNIKKHDDELCLDERHNEDVRSYDREQQHRSNADDDEDGKSGETGSNITATTTTTTASATVTTSRKVNTITAIFPAATTTTINGEPVVAKTATPSPPTLTKSERGKFIKGAGQYKEDEIQASEKNGQSKIINSFNNNNTGHNGVGISITHKQPEQQQPQQHNNGTLYKEGEMTTTTTMIIKCNDDEHLNNEQNENHHHHHYHRNHHHNYPICDQHNVDHAHCGHKAGLGVGENGQANDDVAVVNTTTIATSKDDDRVDDDDVVDDGHSKAKTLEKISSTTFKSVSLTTKADCASAALDGQADERENSRIPKNKIASNGESSSSHVVTIQIKTNGSNSVKKQVTVLNINNNSDKIEGNRKSAENSKEIVNINEEIVKPELRLKIEKQPQLLVSATEMVQKPIHNEAINTANGNGSASSSGVSSVPMTANSGNSTNTHTPFMYYTLMTSGQFSPCETLDSGTGSDLESNATKLPDKPNLLNGNTAPKLTLHLKTTKVRQGDAQDDNSKSSMKLNKSHTNSEHLRASSLTDSEESEASSLSCDSLHSTEYASLNAKQPVAPAGGFLPDSLLRDIRDRKFPTNDFIEKYGTPTNKPERNEQDEFRQQQAQEAAEHAKFLQECQRTTKHISLPPSKTFIINQEQGTFEDTKMNSMPRKYEADKFYNFHVREHENFRSFGNGGSSGSHNGSVGSPDDESEYGGEGEDAFAGYKDIRCSKSAASTIRSSKGTVRGVKNRVRNGIATFLQLQQPNIKNYKEKDSGKVVLYTTSMGIIRDTYAKCANVKQILRTLLVKFEERDVFMSVEYQQEIKERMHSDIIKVPQLFVEGQHIGDAETVERLNESGELRQLLKPYKSISTAYTCQTCGGYRLLPCPSCNGSKKSVHRNHFTAEFVALKCMNCDEVGLVKCHNC